MAFSSDEEATGVNCGWRERFPDNGLANVGRDEERYSASQSVSFLEKLVQQQYDKTSDKQLDDNQETDASSDFSRVSVHSGHYVNNGLSNGNNHAEHCTREKKMLPYAPFAQGYIKICALTFLRAVK